jgi:phosphatidate cytidylyltransferase
MQHIKRWITSLVLGPFVIAVLVLGGVTGLAALVCVVAVSAMREYLRIMCKWPEDSGAQIFKIISYASCLALVMLACLGSWKLEFFVLILNMLGLAVFTLWGFPRYHDIAGLAAKQVFGIVYIPVSLAALVFIRQMDGGQFWIIWLLIVTFINDTGAFYTGTFFGRTRLAPHISPNKTIEGSLGGIVSAMTAGFVFSLVFFHDLNLALITVPGACLMAVAGQVGDLFESAMKRAIHLKDSGHILPGHGGMLDRIDGLLFSVPVLYIFLAALL